MGKTTRNPRRTAVGAAILLGLAAGTLALRNPVPRPPDCPLPPAPSGIRTTAFAVG